MKKSGKNNIKNIAVQRIDKTILSRVKEWRPSGLIDFDCKLSRGLGLPIGKVLEFYGKEATGKSAMSQFVMKNWIDDGGEVLFIDFETDLEPDRLLGYGIDASKIGYATPETAEEGITLILHAFKELKKIKNPPPLLIVWDSVANSIPRKELKDEEEDNDIDNMGLLARCFSKASRKIPRRLAEVKATIIFVNQIRMTIGGSWGDGMTRPAGKGLDFMCSSYIKFVRIKTLDYKRKNKTRKWGYRIEMTFEKNRFNAPHLKTTFVIDFRNKKGIDPALSMRYILKEEGLLKEVGDAMTIKLDGKKESIDPDNWETWYFDNVDRIKKALTDVYEGNNWL